MRCMIMDKNENLETTTVMVESKSEVETVVDEKKSDELNCKNQEDDAKQTDKQDADSLWGGVTVFKRLDGYDGTHKGVLVDSYASFRERLLKPAENSVTHAELEELKKSNAKAYKAEKFKAGLYVSYTCPPQGGNAGRTLLSKKNPPDSFSGVSLDYDKCQSWFVDKLKQALGNYTYFCYSTVTSTTDAPRRRVFIPFRIPVDGEAREAFGRCIANKIGWAGFDESSLGWNQRMGLPVKCKDQQYEYTEGTGEMVDVIAYLDANMPDWKDARQRPATPTERKAEEKRKSAKTPREIIDKVYFKKDRLGLIGAFLRAYTCNDILKRSGLYDVSTETASETRWSRKGNSDGGVVVYHDNETASCFYSTDILTGQRCATAFDLVVLLDYDGDVKATMQAIRQDPKVREELCKGRSEKFAQYKEWGNDGIYPRGWKGLLQRVCEAYPIKTICATDKKGKTNNVLVKWDGTRYVAIDVKAVQGWVFEVATYLSLQYPYLEKEMEPYIVSAKGAKGLADAIFAIDEIRTSPDDWDNNPWLINCMDGIINVKGYCQRKAKKDGITLPVWQGDELEPWKVEHSPDQLFRKIAKVKITDFKDDFGWNTFNLFLDAVQPDVAVQKYLQKALGSSLGDCSADNIFIWMPGKAGSGKSTLATALKGATGDYYGTADISNFYTGNHLDDPTRAQPQLDELRGKKVVIFPEASAGRVVDIASIKKWFGSEVVTRGLYSSGGPWTPRFRGVCDCNEMPQLSNPTDGGVRRRFRVIPWTTDQRKNAQATVRMGFESDPRIHASVLRWLLVGCYEWCKSGFLLDNERDENIPKVVREATAEYFSKVDDVADYVELNLDLSGNPADYVTTAELWEDYQKAGYANISQNSFYARIKAVLEENGAQTAVVRMKSGVQKRGYRCVRMERKTDDEIIAETTMKHPYELSYRAVNSILRRADTTEEPKMEK